MPKSKKEYAVEWTWDGHVHGGYGPVASSPSKAKEVWGKELLRGDCVVCRPVGGTENDWKYHSS